MALVTGASGFIGCQLVPALERRGFRVHAAARSLPVGQETSAQWHQLDLFDHAATSRLIEGLRPTHLVHLAWCTAPGVFWESPDNAAWQRCTEHLITAFVNAGGQRFVGAGSCAEYLWTNRPCSELTTPLQPATAYGRHKKAVYDSLADLAGRVEVAWGRIFHVFGPREHPSRLVAYVIRSLLRAELAHCSAGEQWRDYLYVGDLADAFAELLDADACGAFNLASGQPTRVRDLIEQVAARVGRPELLQFGAVPARSGEPEILIADTSRMRDELGWAPRIRLDEAIDTTVSWWLDSMANDSTYRAQQGGG